MSSPRSLSVFAFVATLGAALTTAACDNKKSEIAPPEAGNASPSHVTTAGEEKGTVSAAQPAAHASVADAAPRFDEEAFEVSLELPTSVKSGTPFDVKVHLKAKAGYKVNQEYPLKFAFLEGEGLAFESAILRKEQGTIEKTSATLGGKVTVGKAGSLEIGGKLSFSVCTEQRCLIEKRDLKASVTAS